MTSWGRRSLDVAGIGLIALMALSGCATAPTATPSPAAVVTQAPTSPAPTDQAASGAVESYLAWLTASRTPDVDAACAALSPDLVARMIAELNGTVPTPVGSCEEMIAATAALYRAVGDDAAVDVAVQQETPTDATLFVTYLASGDCGTVVMKRGGASWIITEQSQECAQ